MKKLGVILALLLCFTAFSTLIGCKEESSSEQAVAVENFYDFEDYGRNFAHIRPFHDFGVVSQNKDEKYVSEGKSSAKLQAMGVYGSSSSRPYIVFPTFPTAYLTPEEIDYDFIDFTNYKCFTGDFYNAQDEEVLMEIGLAISAPVYDQYLRYMETSLTQTIMLKPGWNNIVYNIEHDLMSASVNMKQIFGVMLAFDNVNSKFVKDATTVYVDNFKLEKLPAPHEINLGELELDVDEEKGVYEICSFDKPYQKYMAWCTQYRQRAFRPDFDVVNPNLGDKVGNVLKVDTRYVSLSSVFNAGITFSGALVRQHDTEMMLNDPNYDYYFCLDVYNASDIKFFMRISFSDNVGYGASHSSNSRWEDFTLEPQKWNTVEYNLNKVKVELGKDEDGNTITQPYLQSPGNVSISCTKYEEGPRRTYLVDNIRIERRAKTVA